MHASLPDGPRRSTWRRLACAAWFLVLALVPDPRPLGAPEWAVALVRGVTNLDEPMARLVATAGLRALGHAVLGGLVVAALGAGTRARRLAGLLGAPALALLALWANLGHRPLPSQAVIVTGAAVGGAALAFGAARRPLAAVLPLALLGAVFAWGTATGIDDELHAAARAVGRQVLDRAAQVPDGDEGFTRTLELAVAAAVANSQDRDPLLANQAALLAVAVILGEEQVAAVARRDLDPRRLPEARALRKRITLQGRSDWPQHFWVSAGLTLLSDEDRSITVGLAKELMDATPGGSGFSFTDLAADAAGNAFALAATRDEAAARAVQERILAGAGASDFVPELRDLPEGLTREAFLERFGGLRGEGTQRVVADIRERLAACPGLQ